MKSHTGRQRRIVVMLSSLMICGALLAACQNGSGTEESQNPSGTGNTQQESDGTTVHFTEDKGADGDNAGGMTHHLLTTAVKARIVSPGILRLAKSRVLQTMVTGRQRKIH